MSESFKKELQTLINVTNPKVLPAALKKKPHLLDWVNEAEGSTITEKMYIKLYDYDPVCAYGKRRKFDSINNGFRNGCGIAKNCECTRNSVSAACKESLSNKTTEEWKEIVEKRIETTIEKYGVDNVGKLPQSVKAHKEFYADKEKVAEINRKVAQTKLEKYGNANYNNRKQIKETYKKLREDGYWIKKYPEKNLKDLNDPEYLKDAITKMSIREIALHLNVSVNAVNNRLTKFGLRTPFVSSYEVEITGFINSLGFETVNNKRTILDIKKELDIYIPSKNFAIELNGMVWHHLGLSHIDELSHQRKYQSAKRAGIELFTIWSNQWDHRKNACKEHIKQRLGVLDKIEVDVSELDVRPIGADIAQSYLEENSLCENIRIITAYGYYYQNELVGVITFVESEDVVELTHYHSILDIRNGAKSVLESHLKKYPGCSVYSYSDNDLGDGYLQRELGFTENRDVEPQVFYWKHHQPNAHHTFMNDDFDVLERFDRIAESEEELLKDHLVFIFTDSGKTEWKLV